MANYVSAREKKYSEREATFVAVRGDAAAVKNARKEADALGVWEPSKGHNQDSLVRGVTARRIEDIVSSFNTTQIGSLDFLSADKFSVNYNVYGDLGRAPVLGENTNSIGIDVEWQVTDIKVKVRPGHLDKLTFHEDLVSVARNGIRSREAISKATGWSRQVLQNMSADDTNNLQYAITTACSGSNKLTRLVKGMLLFLETLEAGELDVHADALPSVSYTETDVAAAGRRHDQAYVYNSLPGFEMHEVILTCMVNAYPRPGVASHISIPSDAKQNVMVARGTVTQGMMRRRLNPAMVMSSVCRYASDTDCESKLHAALLIATSLKQNRYFERASLPKVVSFVDLMMPAVTKTDKSAFRPQVSHDLTVSLGRLHQMVSFGIVKDLATAAEMSSSQRVSAAAHVLEYLSRYSESARTMGLQMTGVPVLEGTEELDYMTGITEDQLSAILGTSILEALWLCGHSSAVCENGVMYMLKKGKHDLTRHGGAMEVLREEIREAGGVITGFNLPQGQFFVEGVNLGQPAPFKRRDRNRVSIPITHAHECDETIGRTVIARRNGGIGQKRISTIASPKTPPTFRPARRPISPKPLVFPVSPVNTTSSLPPYSPVSAYDPAERISSQEELFSPEPAEQEQSSPQAWQSVVSEMSGEVNKLTKYTPKDAELMVASPESQKLLVDAGVRLTQSEREQAERIYRLKGGNLVPTQEIMERWGKILLEIDGFEKDSRQMVTELVRRKMIGAWWLDINMENMLRERGVGLIAYEPKSGKMKAMMEKAGHGDSTQKATSMRRDWEGDLEELDKRAWPAVVNSKPMTELMELLGIQDNDHGFGNNLRQGVVRWISLYPHVPTDHLYRVVPWARDTSVMGMAGLLGLPPQYDDSFIELDYRYRASSITTRKFDRADSKFLELASRPGVERWVSQDMVSSLSKEFLVPSDMAEKLTKKGYRLFKSSY
nr:CP [Gnomoniopsis castaneae chrysovirus 1]